jgi:hypothetical protein
LTLYVSSFGHVRFGSLVHERRLASTKPAEAVREHRSVPVLGLPSATMYLLVLSIQCGLQSGTVPSAVFTILACTRYEQVQVQYSTHYTG